MIINDSIIDNICSNGITIEEFMILFCKYVPGNKWLVKYRPKEHSYNKLIVNGYLTATRSISASGKKLLKSITSKAPIIPSNTEEFDKFWKTYPSSDKFKHWPKTTGLKGSKERSQKMFDKIISEKEYTANDIQKALEREIESKSKNSIADNKFKFMKKAVNWLTTREFEN